jgi:hypothetical protein
MSIHLDDAVMHAAPISDEQLRGLSLDAAEAELREAILRTAVPAPRHRGLRVRGWSIAGLTATATAAVLAVTLIGGGAKLGTSPERAWGAAALRVANAVPRLLLGEEGWTITRADEFRVDDGEMTFEKNGRILDLHWRGKQGFARWVRDRANSSTQLADVELLGTSATVFRYKEALDDFTALWRTDGYTMELRSGSLDGAPRLNAEEYRRLLASLHEVSVDAWLSAMPESVVLPGDSEDAIDGMLAGLPLPSGFDRAALREDAVRDRYQLGARVVGAVACAWVAQWASAKDSGDVAARDEAVAAMGTSRRWPILREMQAQGAYPEVLWEIADAMAGDGTVMGGRPLRVEATYQQALGC